MALVMTRLTGVLPLYSLPRPAEQPDTLPGPEPSSARTEFYHRFFWQEKRMVIGSGEGDRH